MHSPYRFADIDGSDRSKEVLDATLPDSPSVIQEANSDVFEMLGETIRKPVGQTTSYRDHLQFRWAGSEAGSATWPR